MKLLGMFFGLAGLIVTAQAGANEPIADNQLGLTAKDCSSSHCSSKDGLLLWLSLEKACLTEKKSTGTKGKSERQVSSSSLSSEALLSQSASEANWSPAAVGSLSAMFGVLGMVVGLASGSKYRRHQLSLFPVA